VIPSGPAALSEGSFLSCSLISSRVVRMLSCGSGMCESEGWGASSEVKIAFIIARKEIM